MTGFDKIMNLASDLARPSDGTNPEILAQRKKLVAQYIRDWDEYNTFLQLLVPTVPDAGYCDENIINFVLSNGIFMTGMVERLREIIPPKNKPV